MMSTETLCNDTIVPVHETPTAVGETGTAQLEDLPSAVGKVTYYVEVPGELDPTVVKQLTEAFKGKRFTTFGRSNVHRERYFHAPIIDGEASFFTVFARELAPYTNFWQFSYYPTPVSQPLHKKVARSLARRRLMVARQQSSRKDNDPSIYLVCSDVENLFECIFRYLHGQGIIEIQ